MTHIQAIILGVIQGLTEFLPISSTGHLVLFQHLFGLNEPELFFSISVHIGTLAAVIIFYRKDIGKIIKSLRRSWTLFRNKIPLKQMVAADPDLKLALLIVLGSVPTMCIGLLLKRFTETTFSSPALVGGALIITGCLLWAERFLKITQVQPLSKKNALAIGAVQGIAVIPGISRSGSTIIAGLFLGLDRETAARFSFLLSIPAIVGAEFLGFLGASDKPEYSIVLSGALAAGIVGFFALKSLVYLVKQGRLHYFSPYCWLVGAGAVLWGVL